MNLPIPWFTRVQEICSDRSLDRPLSTSLILPDPLAGTRARYSVIRIMHGTGSTICIGRELPLAIARVIANRSSDEDNKPLTEEQQKKAFRKRRK